MTSPVINRMLQEGSDLDRRLTALQMFLKSPQYEQLDEIDKGLLSAQAGAMTAYLSILSLRMDKMSKAPSFILPDKPSIITN